MIAHSDGRAVASNGSRMVLADSGPIVIEAVTPELDGGRHPVKRIVGEEVRVEADIFREGHDQIRAMLYYRHASARRWEREAMTPLGNDRWRASFVAASEGTYEYEIEAWPDPFGSWQHDVDRKLAAGQSVGLELVEGRALLGEAIARSTGSSREWLEAAVRAIDATPENERARAMLESELGLRAGRAGDRGLATKYPVTLRVDTERKLAQFSAWYELFPRSAATEPGRHGTFADVIARLPRIAAMGFDIVYLPPIHPIGYAFRKGKNNSLQAEPDDVGSPWAIGNAEGGHTAIEPALGSFDDFGRLIAAARDLGLEVALDYALQCSQDHPWTREHPEWFLFRPDGTIKYAENPPKKYQDIVNFHWFGPQRHALWTALRDVVLFWIERGVTVFRVDNPHTKPFAFWEWMIGEVRAHHPHTIFLAEAFTRPKVMHELAKIGFSQSYTYFTWRDTKEELEEYATELATESGEFYRPNFWPNTPDILPPFLQTGGPPAFHIRIVLAATLASSYGIYSGYELYENAALPGREEYLDSEKYEIKVRDWSAARPFDALLERLNAIRRENSAFADWRNVTFHRADDDRVIFFGKRDGNNLVFVAVNLDPFAARDPLLWFPIADFAVSDDAAYEVEELLDGTQHVWRGSPHRWRLDPQLNPAAIFRVTLGTQP